MSIPENVEAAVHNLYRWRGTVVGGLAQIETTLLDACIQYNSYPYYSGLLKKYPQKPAKMIEHIEALMLLPGPLQSYRTVFSGLFREYEALQENRNLVAHSVMTVEHSSGEALSLVMSLWYLDKGTARRKTEHWLWSELEDYSDKVSDLADRCMGSFRLMYSFMNLPTITTFSPQR